MNTREYQPVFDNADSPSSRFDIIIEWLLAALLAFMPLAFGAVQAWSEEVVIALSGAIVICFLLKIVYHCEERILWTWAYVPIGIFLFVVAFQLIRLPTTLLSIISPNTVAVKTELLGDLPDADTLLKSMTLSFYPYATKHQLRLVLAVAAVFIVVLNVFRRPSQIKRLLTIIALIGGIIAMLALVQDLFGNGKIYWLVHTKCKAYSGPFVNHSHYGQFMNLSIGATIGLLMVKLREDFADKRITPFVVAEYFSSPSARTLWLLVGTISLGAATVFASLTRGGMVSMLVATAFTILLLTFRRPLKNCGWVMAVVALAAFICVLYIGFDSVYDRLATLRSLDRYQDRWQVLTDLTACFGLFPVLGTGLGTHSVVYPMFDSSTITALATHAENEYAQAAEETGLIGLGSLIIFGIIVWSKYVRNIHNANLPIHLFAYGLGFGILAVLFHSLSDFGQHLPANAFLSAIFCALLIALTGIRPNNKQAIQTVAPTENIKGLRTAVLLAVCAIWLWALIGANNLRVGDAHWKKVLSIEKMLVDKQWQGTDEEYTNLISRASMASACQPENIEYLHWLNVYRWHSIERRTDPNTGIIPEDSMSPVYDIVDEFHKARTLCPTFGATYCIVGQIENFILEDPAGTERIRKGFRLAPCDPIVCFVTGFLDVTEDQIEQSVEKFKKAILLDEKLFKSVADIYIKKASRPDLAVSVAGDNVSWLSYIADALADSTDHGDLAQQARTKVANLLKKKCEEPDAPAWAFVSLANIYRNQQDKEAAIEFYRRAITLDYSQVSWRLEFAKLLAETGHIPEAIHQARICQRLRPQLEEAKKLIADLSVRQEAFGEETKSL